MRRLAPEHFKADGRPKRPYPSCAAAVEAAIRQQTGNRTGRPYQAYKCPTCPSWHIGRRPGVARPYALLSPLAVPAPDSEDAMRRRLRSAGWRQVHNQEVERWLAPGVSGREKAGRKKTLFAAYALCALADR